VGHKTFKTVNQGLSLRNCDKIGPKEKIKSVKNVLSLQACVMKGSDTECLILVLMEMGLSFAGIVSNLLIVTAVKEDDTVLQGSTLNYLLFNLCFSNLIISFLVI
jgi:hypothetical protein